MLIKSSVFINICFRNDVIGFFYCFSVLCVFGYFRFYILKFVLVGINKCIVSLEIDVCKCFFIFDFVCNRRSIVNLNIIRGC